MTGNYQSSNPITPLGGNGTLPALPAATITPPTLPNPADRTQELLARTQESVDRGFQMQASVLQSEAQRGQAEAANRTQNSFAGVFSGALSAIGAGFTLYGELDARKKEQQAAIALAEAEAAAAEEKARMEAQLAQQENVAAQIEMELGQMAADLSMEVADSTFSQGNIVTRRQLARSLITESGLTPIQQAQLSRYFNEQINGIQAGLNTRLINQHEEIQDNTLQIQKGVLLSEISSLVVGLVAGNPALVNPASIDQQLNAIYNRFFEENPNIPYGDQLAIVAEGNDAIRQAYEKYGIRTTELNVRDQLLAEAINKYQEVIANTQGNTEARRLGLAALAASYPELSGINWNSIEYTEAQQFEDYQARQNRNNIMQDEALRNDPEMQEFQSSVALEAAYQIFSNPGTLGAEISRLEDSDDRLDQATLYYVNLLTDNRDTRAEIHQQMSDIRIERQELYAEFEKLKDQIDPTNRLGPVTINSPDLQQVIELAGSALQRNEISSETYNQLVQVVITRLQELDTEENALNVRSNELAQELSGTGLSALNLTDYDRNMPRLRQRAAAATAAIEERQRQNQLTAPPGPSNFSAGPMLSTPPIVPLATNADGVTWPAAATELDTIRVTSAYGMRTHPTQGGRKFHQGIDIVIPSGNIRTIAGGTVIHAGNSYDPGGWGTLVTVRTPDGFVEQFNHLASTRVEIGQVIPPGTIIGIQGSTGDSTGPHLDFRVLRPETTDAQILNGQRPFTMNPVDYMRMRGSQTVTAPGVGRPPNTPSPANGNPLSRGQQVWQSLFMTNPVNNAPVQARGPATSTTTVNNAVTPHNQALASTRRNPYREGLVRNDGEANFGYEALRRDRNLRVAIHQTASRLGIPAQWIADVIDYETAGTWSPTVRNGIGCVGMQFCGSDTIGTPGELDEVAKKFGGNLERARQHLGEIGLIGQLEYFEAYFMRYANGGRDLHSIANLYAGWNGGPGRIRNPGSLASDGNTEGNPLAHHLSRLGNRTGRRYDLQSSTRGADIGHTHTTPVAGCPLCNEMLQKNLFAPHIGNIA